MIISRWVLLKMSNVSDKSCRKKSKDVLRSTTLFVKSCRLWDNVGKSGRAGQATDSNIIRRMSFACWITKATNTFRICNTYCFSLTTVVTGTHLAVTLYAHCFSCLQMRSSYKGHPALGRLSLCLKCSRHALLAWSWTPDTNLYSTYIGYTF
jgi:hypothetical protein